MAGRHLALKILNKYDFKNKELISLLDDNIEATGEKSFCRDLVLGVARHKITIDHIISTVSGNSIRLINKRLINIIRVGVYELVYSYNSSAYATVNEAVDLAYKFSSKKSAGFVNAVLRNIQRSIVDKAVDKKQDSKRDLPVEKDLFCKFNIDILPDINTNQTKYFSVAYSLPSWLVGRWLESFSLSEVVNICLGSNRRCNVYLWPNRHLIDVSRLGDLLTEEEIRFQKVDKTEALKVLAGRPVKTLPGFTEGLFSVQDLTAAKVVNKLKLFDNAVIVDYCAAPGAKTAALSQKFPKADIFATDVNNDRLKLLHQSCKRLRLCNVEVVKFSHLKNDLARVRKVDAVLLDVPCSNTGVLAKRVEVRYKLSSRAIDELADRQKQIIVESLRFDPVFIIYSTCSIERQENRAVVDDFLQTNKDYHLVQQHLTLPGVGEFSRDGGYFAILKKK